jgi:HTH-type transcriptional regulator/antitoxin HigA
MEQLGLTRKDLEPLLGSRARVSEVLSRKRPLTLAMIHRLRQGLGLSADVLLGPDGLAA